MATTEKIDYEYFKNKRIYRQFLGNNSYQLSFSTKDSFCLYFSSGCFGAAVKVDSGVYKIQGNAIVITNSLNNSYPFLFKNINNTKFLVNTAVPNNPILKNQNPNSISKEKDMGMFLSKPFSTLLYFNVAYLN